MVADEVEYGAQKWTTLQEIVLVKSLKLVDFLMKLYAGSLVQFTEMCFDCHNDD